MGSKPLSTLTPRLDQDSPLSLAGTSAALRGRSRMCPREDSTTKFRPRYEAILRALAGDSTITSRRGSDPFAVPLFFVLVVPATLVPLSCQAHSQLDSVHVAHRDTYPQVPSGTLGGDGMPPYLSSTLRPSAAHGIPPASGSRRLRRVVYRPVRRAGRAVDGRICAGQDRRPRHCTDSPEDHTR